MRMSRTIENIFPRQIEVIKLSDEFALGMKKREATGKFSFIHDTNDQTAGWSTGVTLGMPII